MNAKFGNGIERYFTSDFISTFIQLHTVNLAVGDLLLAIEISLIRSNTRSKAKKH